MPAEELAAEAAEVFGEDRVLVVPRLDDAIAEAVRLAEEKATALGSGGVLVTGSVITAGEARVLLWRRRAMRSMAAIVLTFEALVLALTIPVLISIADVDTGTALLTAFGLAGLAILAAALLRFRAGYVLGSLVQIGAIGLGFVVPVMFVLGATFAFFWVLAIVLGLRVEEAKRAREAAAG